MAFPAGSIDLRFCKRASRRLFPPGHPVREALAQEPDSVPCEEGLPKLEAYLRMLLALR